MINSLQERHYKIWLNHPRVNAELKGELSVMSDEEINEAFLTTPLQFGTAGVRRKMGPGFQNLNSFTYQMLTEGLAKYLKTKYVDKKEINVVIGHDNRKNSSHFALICAKVLSSFGIKALLFENNELMPTPIISYTVLAYKAQAGINITASHNPKIYNGFKIYGENGAQILDDVGNQIISNCPDFNTILDKVYTLNKNFISYIATQNTTDYFIAAKNELKETYPNITKSFPIIFTGHHGTSVKKMPQFLKMLGYSNVIPVAEQCEYDSDFTNSTFVNPEEISSYDLAIKYADKCNARIILALDPDADRMGCAIKHNEEWKYLSGNEMGVIFSYYLLKNRKYIKQPFIVSTFVSTGLVNLIAKKYNVVVYRTATGFKFIGNLISDLCKQSDLVVGFEEAIGALTSTITRDKDGLQSGALALEIYTRLQMQNKDFVDYLDEIYATFGCCLTKTVSFVINQENWKEIADAYIKKLLAFNENTLLNHKISNINWNDAGDCVEWFLENDSWIRFRKSGTEPKFKIYYNIFAKSLSECSKEINALNVWFKKFLDLKK